MQRAAAFHNKVEGRESAMRQVTRKGLMTVAAATGVLAVTGGYAHADSGAYGSAGGSPGVLSGNVIQIPVHVPVNVCGNSVNVGALGNPATGNGCGHTGGGHRTTPPGHGHGTPPPCGCGGTTPPGGGVTTPPGTPTQPGQPTQPGTPQQPGGGGGTHVNHPGVQTVAQGAGTAQLADTGSDLPLGMLLPAGAGALLGGALLYRRARAVR
jgi:hypothetical protein